MESVDAAVRIDAQQAADGVPHADSGVIGKVEVVEQNLRSRVADDAVSVHPSPAAEQRASLNDHTNKSKVNENLLGATAGEQHRQAEQSQWAGLAFGMAAVLTYRNPGNRGAPVASPAAISSATCSPASVEPSSSGVSPTKTKSLGGSSAGGTSPARRGITWTGLAGQRRSGPDHAATHSTRRPCRSWPRRCQPAVAVSRSKAIRSRRGARLVTRDVWWAQIRSRSRAWSGR